jgi:hypothetical protein
MPTKITAPRYFDKSMLNLDSGLDKSKSIVPLSTIEGINEADDIIQNISTSKYETDVIIA